MAMSTPNSPKNLQMLPTSRFCWVGLALLIVSFGVFAFAVTFGSAFGGLKIGDMWVFGSSGLAFQVIAASGVAGFVALVASVVFRHERSVLGIAATVVGLLWIFMGILFYQYATS